MLMKPSPTAHIHCGDCPIRDRAVCSMVDDAGLEKLNSIKHYKAYEPGREIVAAGEQATQIGTLVTGVVALSKTMADGRRQMIGLMFPGDFIGRPFVPEAPFDAAAVTEVMLCSFERTKFERLMGQTPALEHRLLEMTLDELDVARDWMLLLGRKTASEKIATFIAILAKRALARGGAPGPEGLMIELPITREAMGDYLGLTIETVSRQITALRKSGIVRLEDSRHLVVPDLAALAEAAGDDASLLV